MDNKKVKELMQMDTAATEAQIHFASQAASLEEYAMDIISTNADLSSLLLDIRRHLSSLDLTPDRLLDEMLHLAEHVQHLQCEVSDASYFERNKSLRETAKPLSAVYDKIHALCQLVKTASAAASHYVDSVGGIAYDLEFCFDSLKDMIGEYGALLDDLNGWVNTVENIVPQENLPF